MNPSRISFGIGVLGLLGAVASSVIAANGQDAGRDGTRSSLVGRTIQYAERNGIPYYITYEKDGACHARSDRGTSSGCRWYVEGNRVCHQYTSRVWIQSIDCRLLK
jgi:hypothetical protein